MFNEAASKISYKENACQSLPLKSPDKRGNLRVFSASPGSVDAAGTEQEVSEKYIPSYAGADNGGVVVCGAENEIASDPLEEDHFDISNRKVESHRIVSVTR